jgi:hypothetical protein
MNQETNIQLVEQFKTESELVMSISSMPELQLFMNEAVELFTEYNLRLLSDAQASRFADEFKDWEYSPNIFYGDKHLGWQWKMKLMDVVTTYNSKSQSLFIHNRKALQKFTQHEVPSVKPIYN